MTDSGSADIGPGDIVVCVSPYSGQNAPPLVGGARYVIEGVFVGYDGLDVKRTPMAL